MLWVKAWWNWLCWNGLGLAFPASLVTLCVDTLLLTRMGNRTLAFIAYIFIVMGVLNNGTDELLDDFKDRPGVQGVAGLIPTQC